MRHVGRLRRPAPPELRGRVPHGEAHGLRCGDQRALLVDAEMPSRRDAVHADEREEDRDVQEPVVHEDAAVVIAEPQQEAGDRDAEVDEAGDAAPTVVGELVRADERRDVELVGKLVPMLGVTHGADATGHHRGPPLAVSDANRVRCGAVCDRESGSG